MRLFVRTIVFETSLNLILFAKINRSGWFLLDLFLAETFQSTVEPRFNEPLFNEVLDITNNVLCSSQSYSKMYGIATRYNEFFGIANIIRKPKRKIYLDITNYNVNMQLAG